MSGAGKSREADDLGVEVWSLLLRTQAALVRRLDDELDRRTRLPLSWYDVLLELNAAPGRRLRMQDLSNRAVLSRTRVSRIVDELTRRGLARREPDPSDRRGSYAVLTDEGRRAFRAAAPVYLGGIADHFTRHLDDAELRVLRDSLARVLAAARARPGQPEAPASHRDGEPRSVQ